MLLSFQAFCCMTTNGSANLNDAFVLILDGKSNEKHAVESIGLLFIELPEIGNRRSRHDDYGAAVMMRRLGMPWKSFGLWVTSSRS